LQGIVSFLDPHHTALVMDVLQELIDQCSLLDDLLAGPPHISWHVAESYDYDRLKEKLASLSSLQSTLTARVSGLGLFTGEQFILYIRLVKDEPLARLHQKIWTRVNPIAVQPSSYYAPESWVPHISLIVRDEDEIRLGCVMKKLAFRSFDWELPLDNLAFAGLDEDGEFSTPHQIKFGM
jgi:hypothetical protein